MTGFEGVNRFPQSRTRKGISATYFYDLSSPMSFGVLPATSEVRDGHLHFDGNFWYMRDEGRSKWLSVAEGMCSFGIDAAVGALGFLTYLGNGLAANRFGHLCARDCTIVGYTYLSGLDTTADIDLRVDGVVSHTASISVSKVKTDLTLNVDADAGDVLSAKLSAGTIPNKHRLNLYVRDRV